MTHNNKIIKCPMLEKCLSKIYHGMECQAVIKNSIYVNK